jgi:hypothetical protein
LYHPRRPFEAEVANAIARQTRAFAPTLRVRRNYPYRGWTDGLTTTLRSRFPATRYAGIELEVNQGRLSRPAAARVWARLIALAVRESIAALE